MRLLLSHIMSPTQQDRPVQGAIECINAMVAAFRDEEAGSESTALDRMRLEVKRVHTAFVLGEQADLARQLGPVFWLPVERANEIFLHAYSALFCIPSFTLEALARQPDRFSIRRLPNTIRTTSAFILDAFGYDRRTERSRDEMYWPSPTIRMAHAERDEKARISDAAMAYFALQLLRAAEFLSPDRAAAGFPYLCDQHFGFFGEFLRRADYPFSQERQLMETFASQVDELLAGSDCAELLTNVLAVAPSMGVELTASSLQEFLPTSSAQVVATTLVDA